MSDLISRSAFKSYLEEIRQEYLEEDTLSSNFAAEVIETVQEKYLVDAPAVDAAPVVHSEWEQVGIADRCKRCGAYIVVEQGTAEMNYCPNCGAKMDGGAEDG